MKNNPIKKKQKKQTSFQKSANIWKANYFSLKIFMSVGGGEG